MREKFLLIDGSSLIFRAFFAIRNLTTKDGIHTNGVYGFLNMYKKALEIIEPDYVVVAFDKSGPTFRNKDYEAYKAHREKTPPELSHQFAMLKDVLDGMNVIHIDMQEYEADDILGTLSTKANEKDIQTFLLTGDRDYFQLVGDKANVLYTKKGISELEVYDVEKIREKYDLEPKDLIEVKGLMGDKSDNIPGVPGVGEKTAIKLIKDYKNIDGVYENIENISGKKLKENLEENQIQAFLSRKLGTIYLDVPMDYEIEDFKLAEPNREKLYDLFKKLEFNTLMNQFAKDTTDEVKTKDLVIGDISSLGKMIEDIKNSKSLYFEVFTNEENYITSEISYIGLASTVREDVLVLDFGKDKDTILDQLKEVLEDKNIEKTSSTLR